ncbi:NTP transferase domain-containing protein [Paenibacillus pectinilyticus]|uniref:NTP transferase domain-containing protein n=1 Tax=Paenibacillus pectinilyticus TaxID=512399 RepID=UPI000A6230D2|nr:NTP transferase domain-containing protein [Paenibacillus pectinilyticus]
MTHGKKLVGIYLAAGSSRRMGTAKQCLELAEGISLGGIALTEALHSELEQVIVVVRKGDTLGWLPEEAHGHISSGRCRIAECQDADLGMAYSLRTGIQEAEALGAEGALVMLADQPFIDGAMLGRLRDGFSEGEGYDFIASGDKGVPKPPVILARGMWPAVAVLEGDAGARSLFQLPAYRGQIIEEAEQLKFMDIDTVERYEKAVKIFKHHFM